MVHGLHWRSVRRGDHVISVPIDLTSLYVELRDVFTIDGVGLGYLGKSLCEDDVQGLLKPLSPLEP